ncbi:Transmembrane protease serine 11A, partial [Sciurus carolinensis]|nr:Transmembrane protease serine 11A [Sciurus carolinensis]
GLGKEYPPVERIADGQVANKADWPWQASLQVDGIHFCGASLISEEWLLTAAHCFDTYKNPKLWMASFGTTLSPPLMRRQVQSIIVHENYAAHKHDDDIAVVKLSTPVLFSEDVHKVCLPNATFEVLPKSKVFVTGWGALKANGPFPNTLRQVQVEIISNDVCNQVNVYGGAVSSGMICAGFLTGKLDACEGDSGGPLVIAQERNIWYLIGIVSWGIGCGKENKPGLYTRVTHYRDWIKSKTNIYIIMVFQFPSTGQRTLREKKIHNILNQKIRNARALPIDVSSVQVNGCGKRAVPLIVNRIMSGELAAKAAWPWQASLQRSNIHQCGATLISDKWLVTAAHCFKNNANPRQWTVTFGTTINPPLMKREVKRIIVHERYRSPAREYDIAVVQFYPRVTFSDDIRRICLPEASASFPPNSTVYITGFGALYYGGESQNNLREAKVKIISNAVCKQPQVYGNDIKFGMFCAGYLEGIYDACRGDSGGPLVVKDLKDTWYLIGIVSWGDNCGQKNKPGVYTQVTYYRRWIASKTECGARPDLITLSEERIIGGTLAEEGDWPWQVSLQLNNVHHCGGILISNTWILSAAHCFRSYSNPQQWTATFGISTTSPTLKVRVKSILLHNDYKTSTHENDIAAVQLERAVTFTKNIHRVCLPEATQNIIPGSTAYVTGWGSLTYGGNTVTDLRQGQVTIINSNVCNAPTGYNGAVLSGMLCAGVPEGGVDACQGDSGGPLVQEDSRRLWFLIGIVSWGYQCGLPDKPGVYTRVTAYRNWIKEQTGV